jgi:hypothetical protein
MAPLRLFMLLGALLLSVTSFLQAEGGFKYSYVPKKVYAKQLFPVTIIDTRKEKSTPLYQFDSKSGIAPLSKKPLTIRNGNDNFYTFYFKAGEHDEVVTPRIFINDNDHFTILDAQHIPVKKLQPHKDFCGVLAADMKIRNTQVSHYDEKNYLVTLSVEAYEANLEDMYLPGAAEYGVESLKRKGAKTTAEFYVVVPETQKKLTFDYFNTIKQQYSTLSVPIELLDTTVATQSDLNPKEGSFDKLKKYTFMALAGIFFLMFLLHRDFFYLILGVISLITLLTFYIPHKKICIKQGAPLYILPTENSDISTRINQKTKTSLLGERGVYKKIEYKHGIIGWVKDEDLCKN